MHEKLTKCPNLHDICPKNIFPIFFRRGGCGMPPAPEGGGKCPLVSYGRYIVVTIDSIVLFTVRVPWIVVDVLCSWYVLSNNVY